MKRKIVRNIQQKIDKIIQTFLILVKEKNYENFTTNDIADYANIAVGTIYRYFPKGKVDILKNSFNFVSNKIFSPDSFNEYEKIDFPTVIRATALSSLQAHRQDINYHRSLEQQILLNPDVFTAYHDHIYQYNIQIVKTLQEKSIYFRNIPFHNLIQAFLLIFNLLETFIHRHVLISPLFDNDEIFENYITQMILNTIEQYEKGTFQ